MAYELFTAKNYKRQKAKPTVTVKTSGEIAFNTACLEKLKNINYFQILYDKKKRKLCLRRCQKNSPGSLRLTRSQNYIRVYGKTALKKWNITPKRTYKRPVVVKNDEIVFSVPRS
jgi:hypothetical protein